MHKPVIVLIAIAGAALLLVSSFAISSAITRHWVAGLQWDDPPLALVPDGAYTAEYQHELPSGVTATVYGVKMVVRVVGHKYYAFDILQPERAKLAFDGIIAKVKAQQTLKPDGMAGATVTNTAFLIAASRALVRAQVAPTEQPEMRNDPEAAQTEPSPETQPAQ